ncbi:MAG: flavodoxin family protein, partial [Pseudomonadota bacterium]
INKTRSNYMKILALSCSPRKQGNTAIMLEEALKGAEHEGSEIELFSVSGKEIKPCDGCWSCVRKGVCHINDDMQTLYDKLIEADGIIFGTPIYFYSMAAQAKTILDRTLALNQPERSLANKVGGVVVVAGSIGLIDAIKDLYFFIALRQMLPANFVAAYATDKGDIRKREKGMKAAWDLGRQMVKLVSMNFEYPSEFKSNHFAFGTHTH